MNTNLELLRKKDSSKADSLSKILNYWLQFDKWDLAWKSIDHQRLVSNIKEEHFLSIEIYEEIVDFIVNSFEKDFNIFLLSFRSFLQTKVLEASEIEKYPNNDMVGTTIKLDNIIKAIELDTFLSPAEVKREIIKGNAVKLKVTTQNSLKSKKSQCRVKRYDPIWVTWNELKSNEGPFDCLSEDNLDNRLAMVGLRPSRKNHVSITFDQKEHDSFFVVKKPTFADSKLFDLFKPTDINFKDYGLTDPTKSKILNEKYEKVNAGRRPEGVVRTVQMSLSTHLTKLELFINKELSK